MKTSPLFCLMRCFNKYHTFFWSFLLCINFLSRIEGQSPFRDVGTQSGLADVQGFYGISVGDYDNDAYEDLLFTFIDKPPRLYKNNGDFTFLDITEETGLKGNVDSRAAIWIDYDNDGYLDVYLAGRKEHDQMFHNVGGQFVDVTSEMGIGKKGNSFGINIADIDGNRFPDIYISNFLEENQLFINQEGQWMKNRINYYQIWDAGKSMSAVFFDYDNDLDDDLYLVHDGNEPNNLYERQEDGYYVEKAKQVNLDVATFGMGVDIADINLDGWLDLYITNLYENKLMLNNGDRTFTDISASARVNDYGMGWGTTFLDFDNDGYVDIYLCNDSYFSDYPNQLYRNNGDTTFEKISLEDPSIKTASYGCVSVDIDLDGRLDLIVANKGKNDKIQVLENIMSEEHHWIGFQLTGKNGTRQAIGARVEVIDSNGKLHVDQVTGGNGYSSQGSSMIHFGLDNDQVENVTISWPGGNVQEIHSLPVNRYYTITEEEDPQLLQNQSTSLNAPNVDDYFDVYPNPTFDHIVLKSESDFPKISSIFIISEDGKIWDKSHEFNTSMKMIALPQVNGKFYLHLVTSKGTLTKKIIRIDD